MNLSKSLWTKLITIGLGATMALGVGLTASKITEGVKADAANWVLVTSINDFVDGGQYLLTHSGTNSYLVPGAYTGSNPASATLNLATIAQNQAWTFDNVGTGQWQIFNGSNYLKIQTNNTSGLRTQATVPSSHFTIATGTASNTFKFPTSSTGNRAIARYTSGSDWRSYANTDVQSHLTVYKYTEAVGSPLVSLSKSGTLQKTSYYAGDSFDPTGLTFTATYEDSNTANVTEFVLFSPEPLTAGTTSVTASYTEGGVTKSTSITGLTVTVPAFSIATYTISAKNTFSTSGTAPSGSSASIVETYSTSKQMTGGNSQTVTLSGYTNVKITKITLSMKSNSSSGAGNLTYAVDGGSSNEIVSTANFNTASWYGAWSSSYVDVVKNVDIEVSSSIVIVLSATANSLYCESYTIQWEEFEPVTLSSIAITTPPTKTSYYAGDTFDRSGMVVTASFSDLSSSTISYDASGANGYNYSTSALIAGATTHTISYTFEGVTKTANVTISVTAVVLSSISISGTPTKTTYLVGQSFDPTGITVTATRNNGSTANVTSSTTFTPDPLTAGTTSVTASYTEGAVTKTATVSGLTVNDVSLVSISVSGTPNKTSYYAGENFVPTGVTITAHYDDSSSRVLGFEEVTFAPTPLTAGTTSVTVTFDNGVTEKSTTISGLTVTAVVLNSITIKTPASKTNFKLGETFSYSGLVINANYNSGTVEKTSGFSVTGVDTMVLGAQTATVSFEGETVTYSVDVTNAGANAGEYENNPGVYNELYTGSGMWTTTVANFNMGSSYDTYSQSLLSATDSAEGNNWILSTAMTGTWGTGTTTVTGANLGVNTQVLQPIPATISGMSGYSSLPNYDGGALYIGMNFNVANPAKFSMKFITEKVMDAYVVYSTNSGTSYSILGSVQETTVSDGSTWNEISYAGESSLGSSVRFGVLLLNSATSKIRCRVGDIGIYSYTPGSEVWVSGDFTPLEQATAFANYVMTGIGNNAQGNCAAVKSELDAEYAAMSDPAKDEFDMNAGTLFVNARARMAYLSNWVGAQSPVGVDTSANHNSKSSLIASAVIGIIGLTTIAGFYFAGKKRIIKD